MRFVSTKIGRSDGISSGSIFHVGSTANDEFNFEVAKTMVNNVDLEVSFRMSCCRFFLIILELWLLKMMLTFINQCSRSFTGFVNELWLRKQMLA